MSRKTYYERIKWTPEMYEQLRVMLAEQPRPTRLQMAARMRMTEGQVTGAVDRMVFADRRSAFEHKYMERLWPPGDEERFRVMYADGVAWEVMATTLSRSVHSVKKKAGRLGLPPREPVPASFAAPVVRIERIVPLHRPIHTLEQLSSLAGEPLLPYDPPRVFHSTTCQWQCDDGPCGQPSIKSSYCAEHRKTVFIKLRASDNSG